MGREEPLDHALIANKEKYKVDWRIVRRGEPQWIKSLLKKPYSLTICWMLSLSTNGKAAGLKIKQMQAEEIFILGWAAARESAKRCK
jgi:hypothetical protein